MRGRIMPLALLAVLSGIGRSVAQDRPEAGGKAAERLRAMLLATSVGRPLTIAFRSGESLDGWLAEVGDISFGVWTTPDEETRRRLGITGARVKRSVRFDEVESVRGAGDLLEGPLSEPASSAEGLAYRVRLGDTIYVRTTNGTIKGRLAGIEGDTLRLGDKALSLSGSEKDKVEQIDLRLDDSLNNGILIGTAIGASLATAGALGCEGCTSADVIVGVTVYTATGAGLGALFDGLSHRRERIYVAPDSSPEPRLQVAPLFSRDRKGLLFSWSF